MAMGQKAWEVVEKVDLCRDGHELFRIAKQRAGEKKDVVEVSCYKDESGAVKLSVDDRLHEVVHIDKMQYGFMPGRGTVDAVFVLRRLTEEFRAKNKKLFLYLLTWKRLLNRCQGNIIRFALKRKSVPEYLVEWVMSLYKCCTTAFSVDGELLSSFSVKVGVDQRSALSPLLFMMVMDVLTEDLRNGVVVCRRSCFVLEIIQ